MDDVVYFELGGLLDVYNNYFPGVHGVTKTFLPSHPIKHDTLAKSCMPGEVTPFGDNPFVLPSVDRKFHDTIVFVRFKKTSSRYLPIETSHLPLLGYIDVSKAGSMAACRLALIRQRIVLHFDGHR